MSTIKSSINVPAPYFPLLAFDNEILQEITAYSPQKWSLVCQRFRILALPCMFSNLHFSHFSLHNFQRMIALLQWQSIYCLASAHDKDSLRSDGNCLNQPLNNHIGQIYPLTFQEYTHRLILRSINCVWAYSIARKYRNAAKFELQTAKMELFLLSHEAKITTSVGENTWNILRHSIKDMQQHSRITATEATYYLLLALLIKSCHLRALELEIGEFSGAFIQLCGSHPSLEVFKILCDNVTLPHRFLTGISSLKVYLGRFALFRQLETSGLHLNQLDFLALVDLSKLDTWLQLLPRCSSLKRIILELASDAGPTDGALAELFEVLPKTMQDVKCCWLAGNRKIIGHFHYWLEGISLPALRILDLPGFYKQDLDTLTHDCLESERFHLQREIMQLRTAFPKLSLYCNSVLVENNDSSSEDLKITILP